MTPIDIEVPNNARIQGECDPRFDEVAKVFEKNFREHDELGASVCVTLEGRTVVDLWGGLADAQKKTPWEKDSVTTVFSCTKGAVALCAHILADRGELDFDAPVKKIWPEFAKNGKEEATVRHMLNHTVGVPICREHAKIGGCNDFDYMTGLLADQEPYWKPGTRMAYHMINFGWTAGEIVRRLSGMSLGAFFREAVGDPLGLDFWIGAPEEIEQRFARVIIPTPDPNAEPGSFAHTMMKDLNSMQAQSLLNTGGFDANSPACHRAEIGGGGGLGNARALARMYAPLANGGELDGVRLVGEAALPRMNHVTAATDDDAVLLIATRCALGFQLSMDNRRRAFGGKDSAILGRSAFGHPGAGGNMAFADPDHRMSFGYTMNRMGRGVMLNERGQGLIDAVYRALGCTSDASGAWV